MAVFDVVGVIGMGRAELLCHFIVGLRAEVLVLDPHRNGGAQCESFEGAGQDLNCVGFFAGSDDGRLTRATAVQVGLDVHFGQRQAGRAAIDDHPDAAAMRFAPGGDAEEVSKRVAHDRVNSAMKGAGEKEQTRDSRDSDLRSQGSLGK